MEDPVVEHVSFTIAGKKLDYTISDYVMTPIGKGKVVNILHGYTTCTVAGNLEMFKWYECDKVGQFSSTKPGGGTKHGQQVKPAKPAKSSINKQVYKPVARSKADAKAMAKAIVKAKLAELKKKR